MAKISELPALDPAAIDGQEFALIVKDGVTLRGKLADIPALQAAAHAAAAADIVAGFAFPAERNAFGVLQSPLPAAMVSAAVNQATITNDGRFSIPAGVGNVYYSRISDHIIMAGLAEGDRILFILTLDEDSGSISGVEVLATAPIGTVNFTEDKPNRWVAELTVTATALSSLVVRVISSDAANPVTGSQLAYTIAPVDASPYYPQPDTKAAELWIQSGMAEGNGNLWPAEYQSFSVTAGDSSETLRTWGVTIGAGEMMFGMFYIEDEDGEPAIADRVYVRAASQVDTPATVGSSSNVFLPALKDHPGCFVGLLDFRGLTDASGYAEFYVDNAQTVAGSYTQKAVTVKKSQIYRRPPSTFMPASAVASREWRNDGKIFFENFDGLQDVTVPMFAEGDYGRDYMTFQSRRYDKTGDGFGGGVGSVLEELLTARRVDEHVFQPIRQLTDVGLNEFAMKASGWADQHQGGNVHGGQRRTAPPQLYVDDALIVDPTARRTFGTVDKVVWIEQSQIMDRASPGTAVAALTATKTWEGRSLTLKNEIEFLQPLNMLTLYLFMLSPYANIANNVSLGAIIDNYTMPDRAGVIYPPGGGVNAAYPSETHFVGTGSSIGFEIEALNAVHADFRSWIQSGGSSRKVYMSALGVHDTFGLAPERVVRPVSIGETFTLETKLTVSRP